jgi:hypothetical protein
MDRCPVIALPEVFDETNSRRALISVSAPSAFRLNLQMKRSIGMVAGLFIYLVVNAQSRLVYEQPIKQRIFVLTDITNEPDDQQSLVRFFMYSNEYDIEGIVATSSTHLRTKVRKDKIDKLVTDYGAVRPNLEKHAQGFPSTEYLQSVTTEHLPE